MLEEIVFAGFGGQGVLSLGQIMTYAGMIEGREVCWMPSYGPEMRGGTANCVVSVSSEPISSPILARFDTAVVLNIPSFERFEPLVKPGGLLVYDATLIPMDAHRTDISVLAVPASEEAGKLGMGRLSGMILLGAYLARKPVVGLPAVMAALYQVLPVRYHHLLPDNLDAMAIGARYAEATLARAG